MENWRTIEGTNGNYSVSDLGNVRRNEHYTEVTPGNFSHYKERLLKPTTESSGYLVVKLQVGKKAIVKKIHRLVAETFILNPNKLPCVNHKDENCQNNRADNLEWCTYKENANYGTRNERLRKASGIRVAQYTLDGRLVKIWDSISQASLYFGCKSTSSIRRVCKKEKGRYSYKGFIWRYVDQKVIGDNNLKQQVLEDKEFLIQLIMKTFSKEDLQQIVDSYKVSGEK